MEALDQLISSINSFAWGPPMLIMLGLTGVFLTIGLRFLPWRKVPYAFGLLFRFED